jgi:uncharacterized membrane protein
MHPRSASATPMPAWVKIFGVIYLIAVTIFAAMHLAGGGIGYLDHGEMHGDAPTAEHGQHQP